MRTILSILFSSVCLSVAYANPSHLNEPLNPFSSTLSSSINDHTTSKKIIEEQIQQIEDLSEAINKADDPNDASILNLYNERGIAYFFVGEFERALQDFNYVLSRVHTQHPKQKSLTGTALWGKLFCHAFRSELQETRDDSLQLQQLFAECACSEDQPMSVPFLPTNNSRSSFSVLPVAKFADPYEKITKYECHDRTAGLADKMRSLADRIPLFVVKEIVLFTIDQLENRTHRCCERGNDWTICLGPIADAWKKLDATWDQLVDLFQRGIAIGAFITEGN